MGDIGKRQESKMNLTKRVMNEVSDKNSFKKVGIALAHCADMQRIRDEYNKQSAPLHARLIEIRKEQQKYGGTLPYKLRIERAEVMEKLYQLGRGVYEEFVKLGKEVER